MIVKSIWNSRSSYLRARTLDHWFWDSSLCVSGLGERIVRDWIQLCCTDYCWSTPKSQFPPVTRLYVDCCCSHHILWDICCSILSFQFWAQSWLFANQYASHVPVHLPTANMHTHAWSIFWLTVCCFYYFCQPSISCCRCWYSKFLCMFEPLNWATYTNYNDEWRTTTIPSCLLRQRWHETQWLPYILTSLGRPRGTALTTGETLQDAMFQRRWATNLELRVVTIHYVFQIPQASNQQFWICSAAWLCVRRTGTHNGGGYSAQLCWRFLRGEVHQCHIGFCVRSGTLRENSPRRLDFGQYWTVTSHNKCIQQTFSWEVILPAN